MDRYIDYFLPTVFWGDTEYNIGPFDREDTTTGTLAPIQVRWQGGMNQL